MNGSSEEYLVVVRIRDIFNHILIVICEFVYHVFIKMLSSSKAIATFITII